MRHLQLNRLQLARASCEVSTEKAFGLNEAAIYSFWLKTRNISQWLSDQGRQVFLTVFKQGGIDAYNNLIVQCTRES
jgi:hypothetical protein